MTTHQLHHVAVIVSDVKKSTEFYKNVFGFQQIKRLTASTSTNEGTWFQIGELQLHLLENKEPCPKTKQHFAIVTNQFDTVWKKIVQFGGQTEIGKLIEGFSKRGFVYDLDGNRIELLEP